MSVEKRHAFINIKAISIKIVDLTDSRKGRRKGEKEKREDKRKQH